MTNPTYDPERTVDVVVNTSINSTDAFMVIKGANTTAPKTRLVYTLDILATIGNSLPVYANNSQAVGNSYPVGGLYKTSNGEIRVVV